MWEVLNQFEWLAILTLLSGIIGLACLVALVKALKQLRLIRASTRLLFTVTFIPISLLSFGVLSGMQGYRAFNKEEFVAEIDIRPLQSQQFKAEFKDHLGNTHVYVLEGDEIQIDAKVLKWQPVANLFGLHTYYQLDRISGRYQRIDHARQKQPSVYSLNTNENWLDLVAWRLKYESLGLLLDARYGSATFIAADRSTTYHLFVTTSGLIIKEIDN